MILCITSCAQRSGLAPVVDFHWSLANSHPAQYTVKRGDTLYAIAFRYDQDYRQLAAANRISTSAPLKVGQVLRLLSGNTSVQTNPSRSNQHRFYRLPHRNEHPLSRPIVHGQGKWVWPAQGHIMNQYNPAQGKKGLDIAANKGAKIYASADGVVAYAGSGLAGYGNLIIIKHANQYLTAYGNNARNLVHEGQVIRSGQVIAEMGLIDRRYWGVHFEIRHSGVPVNPLYYLR